MAVKLSRYFPMLREREELLTEIRGRRELWELFESWTEERQEEFLDFCTGVRGVKMLYDAFFTEILDPTYVPERLEDLMTCLIGQKVRILQVLPRESPRLADEKSLLVMDMVVQLEDGSIVNVEMQKIGYAFPGQRSACYSADLLQKFLFIPLDIFQKRKHNKVIEDKTEAWLTFLSSEDPEQIVQLLETYPEFNAMYGELYELCRNVERVMGMFSKELRELDQNTVDYMIDEMQQTIDRLKEEVEAQKRAVEAQKREAELRAQEYERALEEIARLQR